MSLDQKRQVNDRIIKALQEGLIPWRCDVGFPRNILSRLRYDGVNPLLLNINCEEHKWATAYWGTYDQWISKQCYSKPIPPHMTVADWHTEIVVYKPQVSVTANQDICSWTVFNLDQIINGFDDLRTPPRAVDYGAVDSLIASTKADIREKNRTVTEDNRAYNQQAGSLEAAYYYDDGMGDGDYIIYPSKEAFTNGPGGLPAYYNSLFHELVGHWSEPRLGVDFGPVGNELRAEICADYLCTELGIPRLDISKRGNHRNHLDRWIKMMREDPDLIFRVTASASKAVDFILSFSRDVEPRHNPPAANASPQVCQPSRQSPPQSVPQVLDSDTVSSQKQAPMQQEFIFHPKDTPGPSAELRTAFLSTLYRGFRGHSEAVKVLQSITFDAISKHNHVTNEVHVALIGPASSERAALINLHNRSRQLRLVEISQRTVKTAHDVFNQISKVAADATLTLVEFQPGGHYILPPMDILLDDFHSLPDDLRRRVGNAIEHGTLETEKGFTVDCKNIHWIITAPDSDSLLRAFDPRLTIPHTDRLVKIMLGSQSEPSSATENVPTNERRPVEKPQEDASHEEPPATLKFPGGTPSDAPSQKQQQKDNLRRWRESHQPRNWVEAHHGRWNHGDWLALLDTLRRSDFWPLDPESLGEILEVHRKTWASSVQRQADELARKDEQHAPDISPEQPPHHEKGQEEGSQAQQAAALPLDESDLRKQLTAYSASLLGPGANEFKGFGDTVTITGISSCFVYQMELETTWEKRELVRKQKPFDGSSPKNPTVTETGLNVWSYSLPSDKKEAAEYPVSGSDKAIACDKCGASGQVSCRKCGGSGYIKCPTCKGTHRLQCSTCKGLGYTERSELSGQKKARCSACKGCGYYERKEWAGQRREPCPYWCKGGYNMNGDVCYKCNGSGFILIDVPRMARYPCTTCGGSGSVSEDVFKTVRYSCGKCDGNGAVKCSNCQYTDGTVDCGTCKKKGVVSCSGCKGNGYTGISYLAIKQSFSSNTATGHSTHNNVPHDTLVLLLTPSDYDEVLNLTKPEFRQHFSMSLNLPEHVKEWVEEWVQKAIADSPQSTVTGTRIVKQRLKVFRLPSTVCQYTHCGKEYTFSSLGKRHVPFATTSPMEEYLAVKDRVSRLRGRLLENNFLVWLMHTKSGRFFWALAPCCGLLLAIWQLSRPEEVRNSSMGVMWLIGGTCLAVLVAGSTLCYKLFADKETLEKKKAEINAPILTSIQQLEGELDTIRQGIQPREDTRRAETQELEEKRKENEQTVENRELSDSSHEGQEGGAVSEAHTSNTKPASDASSFSGWRAYLFVGLWVGLGTGITVGIVAEWVGGWFNDWWLVFRIPAKLVLAAILAAIAGLFAGLISGGIVGNVTANVSTMSRDKNQLIGMAGAMGLFVGLVGGPICVFIEGMPGLITGGVVGALFGLALGPIVAESLEKRKGEKAG